MALINLCRLNKKINLQPSAQLASLNDVMGYSQNFVNSARLAVPPYTNPKKTLAHCKGKDDTGRELKFQFHHGTTTLGFRYQGGVLLAVDSRAVCDTVIGSQSIKKVVEINDYMLGTLAGGAADCIYWDRVLAKHCRLYELRNKERMSVGAASKLMANMVYSYKDMGLSIGMMIAGFDKRGAQLYYVDDKGARFSGKVFAVGSGSVNAFGILDSGYTWDLTDEEAQELGRRSIYHATRRDGYSGGIIRVYQIKESGWSNISNQDCNDLHYQYQAEKGCDDVYLDGDYVPSYL